MSAPVGDDAGLRAAFLDEAEDLSRALGESLQALETRSAGPELVNELFRLTHSLKSESALMGYATLSGLAHGMEDVLGLARDGSIDLDAAVADRLVAGADLVAEVLARIRRGGSDADFDTGTALRGLAEAASRGRQEGRPAEKPTGTGRWRASPEAAEGGPGAPGGFVLSPQDLAQLAEARDRGEVLFRLTLSVNEGEPMKFARAYLAFSNLEAHANVIAASPRMDGEPAEDAAYGRTVLLLTSADGEDLLRGAASVDQVGVAALEKLGYATFLSAGAGSVAASRGPWSSDGAGDGGGRAEHAAQAVPEGTAGRGERERTSIRVDTRRLDDLWSLIAELVMHKAQISRLSDALGRGADAQSVREGLTEAFDSLDKISTGMQQAMVETRMIPISVIFSKLPRLVRDLSRRLGKSVELVMEGEDTEIDRAIVEALSEPLTHLIRNSLDHGVEFPEERVRLGKNERGRITVSARRQGSGIVIEIADDGRGLDLDAIRRKAVETGVKDASLLGESRLLELVFLPGFSTREVVTDLSGRGVGMDVVATRIRGDLRGDVSIRTDRGRGTRVSLTLPLTLTIVNALLVRGGNHFYALPLADVDSTTTVLGTELHGGREVETSTWEGEEIPVYSLGALLGQGAPRAEEHTAAVLRHGDQRALLIVDELIEEREVVIKPLDELLNRHRLFSGVSVLEDGRLVFILDTSSVLREHSRQEEAWAPRS